jgi:hypothetical protein
MFDKGTIARNAQTRLNLANYANWNQPWFVGKVQVSPPEERQYILRMLIKRPHQDIKLPAEYAWALPIIERAFAAQEEADIRQPFCYLTIRHGVVDSVNDDVWHVDGFSLTIHHIPEQNYVWANTIGTEVVLKSIKFPADFDSQRHNIHLYLQDSIPKDTVVFQCPSETVVCMDPYVIHRRPKQTTGQLRTFARVSFTPIEIEDTNNTLNPLLATNYVRDGVVAFRDQLERYK